ncbi:tetratricopeptide repeat protein [Rhizobacter sp. SG703]|uniref:tetratricopeptide repeat protein n=1 Tax=Rhizobacter sp. SG703 TaxID=2587140 RepID=UPI001446DDB4|nr:tetratricopeptide repeat protein [Rhizobacter sp. SG703]NKI94997.1 tetratricopeptide (TPR) repeat protein [Rhizobacter sp. SG703]
MVRHPPNLQSVASPVAPLLPAAVVDALLALALAAHKAGTLDELLRRRPRFTRWFSRRFLRPVLGTSGDALRGESAGAEAVSLWLRWAVLQLRPDQHADLGGIESQAWIERTSWRPFLAVMCHFGFAPVPDFRQRYHRRPDESPAENLCGLWAVGPSTFYRYLDKGRRLIAEGLMDPLRVGEKTQGLRRMAQAQAHVRLGLDDAEACTVWHRLRAADALLLRDAPTAWWHQLQAKDWDAAVELLQRFRIELAADPETDLMLERMAGESLPARVRFAMCLAQASIWQVRSAEERERQAYEQALRIAGTADDKLMLGQAYGALGKFYELRDTDRAFVCYEDSAEFLRLARQAGEGDEAQTVQEYLGTLVKLAWLHVLRNDPRSRTVLEKAEQLRSEHALKPEAIGMLEQTWGEYWRRAGELQRALMHKHRALNIFERLGDQRSILITYLNLSLIHGGAKDFERAIACSERILDMGKRIALEPEMESSTRLNLGATYFWQGRYDLAIEQYRLALDIGSRAKLPLHMRRAHYNLAEAHYKRFQIGQDAEDERLGDAHAAAALKGPAAESDPGHAEATRNLKAEILGPRDGQTYDRLLPEEFAAHFEEMAEVQRQRAVLAVPMGAQAHISAHLAIANAYLAISSKEREAALSLIGKHGLGDEFAAELEGLRATFNRELTREQQLATRWQQQAGELLQEQRRIAVLDHLFRAGSIQKSIYAQVCGVGLATASKHLSTLAQLGLLEQTGNGPSTRYVLPP